MSFALVRYPEVSYETEEEAIEASNSQDAAFVSQKNIEETLESGEKVLVSVAELKSRLTEREIARETDEESVAPEAILEGDEEKFEGEDEE